MSFYKVKSFKNDLVSIESWLDTKLTKQEFIKHLNI